MDLEAIKKYLATRDYYPEFLRDFHDQKDFFKALHYWMRDPNSNPENRDKMPSWREGHIYVIDYFLVFAAMHGWTLQKSPEPIDFAEVDDSICELKKRTAEQTAQSIAEIMAQAREDNENISPQEK